MILLANTGDGMPHSQLSPHHTAEDIGLVGICGGDQQICPLRPRQLQQVDVHTAANRNNIQRRVYQSNPLRASIDNRHIMAVSGQILGQGKASLARAYKNNVHSRSCEKEK